MTMKNMCLHSLHDAVFADLSVWRQAEASEGAILNIHDHGLLGVMNCDEEICCLHGHSVVAWDPQSIVINTASGTFELHPRENVRRIRQYSMHSPHSPPAHFSRNHLCEPS
jgi:hypothetical protein